MNVWLGTLGLVYARYSCSGENHDGYVLRDCCLSIVGEEARVWVPEGFIVAVGLVDGERCTFWVHARGCNGCRGSRGGEVVGYDGQGNQWYVVLLGQTDRSRRGCESGPESAVEGGEGYAEVYGVIFDGGLDGVGFEDCILIASSQLSGCFGGAEM